MFNLAHKPSKKTLIIACVVAVLVITAIVLVALSSTSKQKISYSKTTPDFSALVPIDNTKPDWKKIRSTSNDQQDVYIFTDAINGIKISVSQQTIPNSFKNDKTQKVSDLAKSFNASETMQVAGTKVYIGTSAKGPQSVIFTTDKLLVLIKSENGIDDGAWADYISSLLKNY